MHGFCCLTGYRLLFAVVGFLLVIGIFQLGDHAAADGLSPVKPDLSRSTRPASIVAPAPDHISTSNCNPCLIRIGQELPPFSVRFKISPLADGRRLISELKLSRDDKPGWEQSLPVHDMTPATGKQEFFIAADDINFDGFNDLYLVTSRGLANAYADYWLFVPSEQSFTYLGNYPIFTVDSDNHRLLTNERGGYGGMIYQTSQYRFVKGVLTLVELEKQEATNREGVYRKRQFRLKAGKMRLIKAETIRAPLNQ